MYIFENMTVGFCKVEYDKPRQHIKKQRHYFTSKGPYIQSYGFSSIYVWMWELYHKEGWRLKNWYFWIVVLEKNLESPLDSMVIKPINSNQSWTLIGKTDAEAETPSNTFSPLIQRADSLEKTLMLGKIKAGKEGDDGGQNGWMASLTQWTWVWAKSREAWSAAVQEVAELDMI